MNEEGRKAGTEVFFSCLPDFLIQKVFQALERGRGGFSKHWKVSRKFFRALENLALIFPRLGKRRRDTPPSNS
jgi:hypothetical protein